MTFVFKKISDHGTANPIVARLGIQTSEIINFFHIEKDKKDEILDIYMNQVTPRLIRCDEIAKSIAEESEKIKTDIVSNNLSSQSNGRIIELPQVMDLVNRAETFLYNAKSSLRDIAKIFNSLFNEEITHSRYNEIIKVLEKKYGSDSPVVKLLKDDEAWIRNIVDMRNAVEHPSSKMGPLNIQNFDLLHTNEKGQRFFQGPVWFFNENRPSDISSDMSVTTDNILRLAEDLLIVSYIQLHSDSYIQFSEIPDEERDPDCPIRLRAVLDQTKLKSNNAPQPDA
jgi:hypothetical protein